MFKTLFVIALPIILQNLMQSTVNMLDTLMVGQLGSVEIAAVGLGNQIYVLLNMVLFGVSSGGAIFVAQFWGKKDKLGIWKMEGVMFTFSLIISFLFSKCEKISLLEISISFPCVLLAVSESGISCANCSPKYPVRIKTPFE